MLAEHALHPYATPSTSTIKVHSDWCTLMKAVAKCERLKVLSVKGCSLGDLGEHSTRNAGCVRVAHRCFTCPHKYSCTERICTTVTGCEEVQQRLACTLGACCVEVLDASQNRLVRH
jgi:hypothetical protein